MTSFICEVYKKDPHLLYPILVSLAAVLSNLNNFYCLLAAIAL